MDASGLPSILLEMSVNCTIPRLVLCYSDKINIYNNCHFLPLPVEQPPLPPPSAFPVFRPTDTCGKPYPTPMYHPPYNPCNTVNKCAKCAKI